MKDVAGLLEAACLLVPEEIATEDDVTVHDVWEYLVRDEWDVARTPWSPAGRPPYDLLLSTPPAGVACGPAR
ncbi:hypothetical protein [Streptomyces sp. NPDC046942]|uniref:hypothetical protein n=1 Tax=Streptomyces sp. NPDC046942 TaxID=3155137 RepID=UPI0034083A97